MDRETLITLGIAANLIISSGSLWKFIEFARQYGRLEQKVDGHEARLDDHDQELHDLRPCPVRNR